MEQWRINNLLSLGIDFSKGVPYQSSLVFDDLASYRGNYSTYLNGIFFVNGTVVSKGEAFPAFLAKTNLTPDTVIFVDDREDNLKSLEAAIQTLGKPIEYVGVHFLGAQKYPSKKISEVEFESRWQQLAAEVMKLN
jgi:hypothetical protein